MLFIMIYDFSARNRNSKRWTGEGRKEERVMGGIFSKTDNVVSADDDGTETVKSSVAQHVRASTSNRKRPASSALDHTTNGTPTLQHHPQQKRLKKQARADNHIDEKEKDHDLRGLSTFDVPVKKKYLLRVQKDTNGNLQLNTMGKPLYSPNFFNDIGNKHLILTPTFAKVPIQTGTSNSLTYQLRTQLRKHTFQFTRSTENLSLWSDELFANRDLIGAFGIPDENKRRIDLNEKLYLAPLTTVGNLPFRRTCKLQGADITCGEMAMSSNLLKGKGSEWALTKRHSSEDCFGIQLADSSVDRISRASELVSNACNVDFIEINSGCPIDLIFNRGGGCSLMSRKNKLCKLVWNVSRSIDIPVGVKLRTGISSNINIAHELIPDLKKAGAQWITIHGRSRKQRYSKYANWNYLINTCAPIAKKCQIPLLGNGDVYNWRDAVRFFKGGQHSDVGISSVMIARGALIKPWIFKEIKERRYWDIRSSERLDIYKDFVKFGLGHWGSDERGVDTTRRFLLEWLSFTYRYVPVGIIEEGVVDEDGVTMAHRAPFFRGRDDLETLLGSPKCSDWVKITEMLLGKVPKDFDFVPKHKSNAWGSSTEDNAIVKGYG